MIDHDPGQAATVDADVAIVGAGAAGLHVALEVAEAGGRACLISRKPLSESASFWAQGGLAAALDAGDSPELHAEDTLRAGRGACRVAAVEALTRDAPAAVEALRRRGVEFDSGPDGILELGLEGGHSARRIVHSGGAETGRALTGRLAALVDTDDRIGVLEGTSALALLSNGATCGGVLTDSGAVRAGATVLATGGGAALWQRTTNPWGAIGAGCVLAYAAGAELADLEFCQFHPTAIHMPGSAHDGKLITEAVRGEGALLLDAAGERFTDELAPRDEVTAAILERMLADATDSVWLDMRPLPAGAFPSVVAAVREAGLDPDSNLVPVSPAAHYLMGGIVADLDGRTSVERLYAVGECACSGVHGANRLASNSLSECFVFGTRAARAALDERPAPAVEESRSGQPPPRFAPPTAATREALWRLAGPRREADELRRLLDDPYPLARRIAVAALAREESRGTHQRVDFRDQDAALGGIHLIHEPGGGLRRERW